MNEQNDQESLNTPLPEAVIRKEVPAIEVGRAYLKAEFGGIFPGGREIREAIDNRIDQIEDPEFWRLVEGISFSYCLNGVFRHVGGTKYTWSEEEWAIANLTLHGMNPRIDAVTHSPEIDRDPIKFWHYLKDYFQKHPQDDPEGLDQFRPTNRPIIYPKIILREREEKLLLVDGSNRLISFLFRGKNKVTAFVGRATNPEGKMRIGNGSFLNLKILYQYSRTVEEKKAILKTVRALMDISSDGYQAIKTHWVDHVRDEKLKVGKSLLEKRLK